MLCLPIYNPLGDHRFNHPDYSEEERDDEESDYEEEEEEEEVGQGGKLASHSMHIQLLKVG
jgi:hypothetical protein